MANRYQDDRPRRDRFQGSYGRQEEQFQSFRGSDDDRYGQMGDSLRDYDDPDTGWRSERERGLGENRFGSGYRGSWRERENRGYGPSDFRGRDYSSDRAGSYRGLSEATTSGAGSQLAANHGEWREPSRDYSDYRDTWGGSRRSRDYDDNDRGFLERAGDTIAHWLGDDADYRRGERGYRGRGPANYSRSDDRIREDACDRLTEDWRVDASEIEIRVENGELTLDGTVGSREQKRRAEDCVDDLSGVRHVQNNLRVREESWGQARTGQANPTTTKA